MSDPGADCGAVDIRPVQPVGIWYARIPGGINLAFPGASRHWRLITRPWNWFIMCAWVVVPAFVFLLLIGFGVIS